MIQVPKTKEVGKIKKFKFVLLSSLIVATILSSIFAISMIRAQATTPGVSSGKVMFTYTAKFICNIPRSDGAVNPSDAESVGLVPAEYKTDINVHNPGPSTPIIVKKFVLSVVESPNITKPAETAFNSTVLGPDAAFFITCQEIQALLNFLPLHAFKGFAILTTTVSNLDVIAEYTSEAFDSNPECPFPSIGGFANVNCVESSTLEVEKISAVSVSGLICSLPPSSTITASPSSLTISKGSTGTSTITITNLSCFPMTECFSVTAPSSITASISPTCLLLPPGGSGTATLAISVAPSAASGFYTVTVTATCSGCSPSLVQTTTIMVTVP